MSEKQLVVLISGQGRNLQALIDRCGRGHVAARIACVISNREDAAGLARAREAGLPTRVIPHQNFTSRDAFDAALADAIESHEADIVALAGFMRVLGADIVRRFQGRLLNIHPSLLPKYPGLRTHERVIEAGDAEHGASVHFVTPEVDGGPVAIQGRFSVGRQDTAQSLAERVMQEVELKIYPQAVAWMASDDLRLDGNRVIFRDTHLREPLSLKDVEPRFR